MSRRPGTPPSARQRLLSCLQAMDWFMRPPAPSLHSLWRDRNVIGDVVAIGSPTSGLLERSAFDGLHVYDGDSSQSGSKFAQE